MLFHNLHTICTESFPDHDYGIKSAGVVSFIPFPLIIVNCNDNFPSSRHTDPYSELAKVVLVVKWFNSQTLRSARKCSLVWIKLAILFV